MAVFGALTVALGKLLGLELDHVALLGVALGAVIGLVPDRTALARIAGFFAGVVVALAFFALRASVLPDSASGRAVAVFIALIACMAISAATVAWVPLWSILVGAAALVGAYETAYTDAPSQFLRESPTAVTTVLLAAAMGHLAASLFGPELAHRGEAPPAQGSETPQPSSTPDAEPSSSTPDALPPSREALPSTDTDAVRAKEPTR